MDGLSRHQRQAIEHQKELAIGWAVEEAIKKWIRVSGSLALIIVIGLLLFLMYGPRLHGDIEIYLDHNAYAEYEDETYTRIYATKYTWWGLGPDKYYEIKAIKGKWHIRERSKTNWTLMDFDGLGMAESDISEPFYSR